MTISNAMCMYIATQNPFFNEWQRRSTRIAIPYHLNEALWKRTLRVLYNTQKLSSFKLKGSSISLPITCVGLEALRKRVSDQHLLNEILFLGG